jgi:hypothetical protein
MKVVIEMLTKRVEYARFREVYVSEAFNREVIAAVNLKERTVREHEKLPDGKEKLRVYIVPRVDLPSVISKLVGENLIAYEELTIYDPATRRAEIKISSAGSDLVQVSASSYFTDDGDGVRTHIDLLVNVKIFGIGSMIERFVVNETRKRYETVERVLQQFIDSGSSDNSLQASSPASV